MSVQIIMDRDIYLDAPVTPVTLTNAIYAGDADAQRIRFRCFQKHGNIAPMDLSEITITAHFIRPDGGDVVITGTGGSTYSYVDLPEACYVYPGIFKLLVRASTSTPDVVTSILYVTGRIDKPTTDVIIDPGTTIPSLEDLLAQIDACEAAEEAANAAAASATAAAASGVRTDTDAQGLTDTQKANARTNIGAADAADVSQLSEEIEIAEHLHNDTATANARWPGITLPVVSGKTYTIYIAGVITEYEFDKVYIVQGATNLTDNIQIGSSATFVPSGNDPVKLTVRFTQTPSVVPNVVYYLYPAETAFRGLTGAGTAIQNSNKAEICNSDCNDIPNNTIFGVGGDVTLTHDPGFGAYYSIITLGKLQFRSASDFQIATRASDGVTKIRTYYNATNGWSAWVQIGDASAIASLSSEMDLAVKGAASISTSNKQAVCGGDCNEIPNNTIFGVGGDAGLSNAPVVGRYYAIATFGKSSSRTAGDLQIASDTYNGAVYYRNYINGTAGWTAWKKIQEVVTDESEYSGIGMFQRFGVIGDSFASGPVLPGTPDPLNQNFNLSWGQVLARSAGVTCVNYSAGGCGTYRFLDTTNRDYNTHLMGKVLSDISGGNPCDLYLLCLGINDSNSQREFGNKHGGLEYLGSSADINTSDYTQNANSFWGNYGKIIAQIKALTPDSRIVMCTYCRKNNSDQYAYAEYISAIQQIAEFFDLPCITLTDDVYFSSNYYINGLVDNHPTAPLHVGYAKAIDRLLSRCIVADYDYFKDYVGI